MSDPIIGVVVVAFNAQDEIAHCLESLMAGGGAQLRIVVVDNASSDATLSTISDWADGSQPYTAPDALPFDLGQAPKPVALTEGGPDLPPNRDVDLTLLHSGANLGFAGGVNVGLAYLARFPEISHFWVLNPDSMVPPGSVTALQDWVSGEQDYALLGGRVVYLERPDRIQIDGGLLNRKTGVTGNYNLGKSHATSAPPQAETLDFITGASMVASREFYEAVGPMREDYFLYYEEVDWAMRRGARPLAYCPGLLVYHWGGTAIGSPIMGRSASAFSLYFKHRGRMRFLRRFYPASLPIGAAYSLAQAARLRMRGEGEAAKAVLAGGFGLKPPRSVSDKIAPDAHAYAFAAAKD